MSCIVLLALSACASGRTTVVLLPDPDGTVGAASVRNEAGEQVLDQAGQGVVVDSKTSAPGPVVAWQQEDIERTFGPAMAAMPQLPAKFILYFRFDSDQLNPESQEVMPSVFQAITQRDSTDISINGHTDRSGDAAYNLQLSKRRVEWIKELLVQGGVSAEHLYGAFHGEADPIEPTPDGKPSAKNRRVEVIVR